jgi:hypothetical protein
MKHVMLSVTDFLYVDKDIHPMSMEGWLTGHGCSIEELPQGKLFEVKSGSSVSLTYGYKEAEEKIIFSGNRENFLKWNKDYQDNYW